MRGQTSWPTWLFKEKTRRAAEEAVAEHRGAAGEHEAASAEMQGMVQDITVGVTEAHEVAMAKLEGMVQDILVNVSTVQSETERVDQWMLP